MVLSAFFCEGDGVSHGGMAPLRPNGLGSRILYFSRVFIHADGCYYNKGGVCTNDPVYSKKSNNSINSTKSHGDACETRDIAGERSYKM